MYYVASCIWIDYGVILLFDYIIMTEFTNETQLKNPSAKFISFKGTSGKWVYFDKSLGEKGDNVEIKAPIDFIVLDELSTIRGYHDASQSGIYSNEVRKTSTDTLWVKAFKGGDIDSGLYKDIKGNLQGGKYSKSVYAMLDGEIVNFNFVGISLSSWIEKGFTTRNVRIESEMEKGKKGTNEYYIPKFTQIEPDDAKMAQAKELHSKLQDFLAEKLQADKVTYTEEATTDTDVDDDLPF